MLLRITLLLAFVYRQADSFTPVTTTQRRRQPQWSKYHPLQHEPPHTVVSSSSSSSSEPQTSPPSPKQQQLLEESVSPDGTVRTFVDTLTNQKVTLVGTAHLSKKSNQQVIQIMKDVQPDVLMVELDPQRLERVGVVGGTAGLPIEYCTVEDIHPAPLQDDIEASISQAWHTPFQNLFLDVFTTVARSMLTGMYNNMGESMELKGGGEFLAAIQAAQDQNDNYEQQNKQMEDDSGTQQSQQRRRKCTRIVLGDRDSLQTIRRAGELALRSGDPMGVLSRLASVSEAEMGKLEDKVRAQQLGKDEAEIKVAIVEAMKSDPQMRHKLFSRLEEEVPEFARAFIIERDYIMAEAVRREAATNSAQHIVAVVGAAHLPGMSTNLQRSWATATTTTTTNAIASASSPSQLRQESSKPGVWTLYNAWVRKSSNTFQTESRRTAADESY